MQRVIAAGSPVIIKPEVVCTAGIITATLLLTATPLFDRYYHQEQAVQTLAVLGLLIPIHYIGNSEIVRMTLQSTTMTDRISTKLYIQHPEDRDIKLVGILEQLKPIKSTHGRKIALILHGTMGHKDYLFQKRLAVKLPLDSFRFDFRGNHETGGQWRQGALADDIVDLQAVVDYLKATYGYVVELLVGHSRGAIVSFRWLSTTEDGRKVGAFVNASGRYRMAKILESPAGTVWREAFEKYGSYTWNVTVARKNITAIITPEDLSNFVNWDTSIIWDQFPAATDVLTLHGLSDTTVPPYDALIYARALGGRTPGTHTLHLMEDADHNFAGRQDDVVDAILQWWDVRQRGELKTGIWAAGIKGKL